MNYNGKGAVSNVCRSSLPSPPTSMGHFSLIVAKKKRGGSPCAALAPSPLRGEAAVGFGAPRVRRRGGMWRGGSVARGLLALGLGVALEALASWLLRRRRRAPAVREVLFFPSRVTCVEGLLAEREAGEGPRAPPPCACPLPHCESALSRLVARVLAARRSLELCLFAFSSPQLGRVVLLLHGRGVRVRVVTDTDYMALAGSQIGRLRKAGERAWPAPGRGGALGGGASQPLWPASCSHVVWNGTWEVVQSNPVALKGAGS